MASVKTLLPIAVAWSGFGPVAIPNAPSFRQRFTGGFMAACLQISLWDRERRNAAMPTSTPGGLIGRKLLKCRISGP